MPGMHAFLTTRGDSQNPIVGRGWGARGIFHGELVFTTAMTGYMEALTDPSYVGQILVFSYPLIGNYGTSMRWAESRTIHPVGVVVSEYCDHPVHRKNTKQLARVLSERNVGGLSGVDTRAIVRSIRSSGAMPATLSVGTNVHPQEVNQEETDWVFRVSSKRIITYQPDGRPRIGLIDYGYKLSIRNTILQLGCSVTVFPAYTVASVIMQHELDGIVLSNGPGDPAALTQPVSTIRNLMDTSIPMLGICLGHQLLGIAAGGKTYKLKFGHRGLNQPVFSKEIGRAFFTSQNHGYAVEKTSLPKAWMVSFINVNDGTVEGLCHNRKPWSSVQFHPEAHPGPRDTTFILSNFVKAL